MNRIGTLLLALLLLHTPLWAAPGPRLGLHIAETATLGQYRNHLDAALGLGVRVARVPVDWAALAPDPDTVDTAYRDEVVGRVLHAQANGQQVIMMLAQSPAWASGADDPAAPPTPAHYADFGRAMADLHDTLLAAGVAPQTVLAWEVWNEPNVEEFWPGRPVRDGAYVLLDVSAASEYAGLLTATWQVMQARHPGVRLLGGSLASADTAYLEALYAAFPPGVRPFHALSVHPYARVDVVNGPHYGLAQYPDQCNGLEDPLAPPWCFKQGVENLRAVLDRHGDADVGIWFTEFGVDSSSEWGGAGDEYQQAEHLERALDVLADWARRGDLMRIPVATWYRLLDEGPDDLFGLLRADGSRKPVADALRNRLDAQGRLIVGPAPPRVVTPAEGGRVNPGRITLRWVGTPGASNYYLRLEYPPGGATGDYGWDVSPQAAGCAEGLHCSWTVPVDVPAGDAAWRVSADYPDGRSADGRWTEFHLAAGDPDPDADGHAGAGDNCPLLPNHDQRDSNGDGIGNACDADFDGDGRVNFADLAALRAAWTFPDADRDLDGSGLVTLSDLDTLRRLFLGGPGSGDW